MRLVRVSQADLPLSLAEAKEQCRVLHADEDAFIGSLAEVAVEKVAAMSGLVLANEVWELTVSDPVGAVCLPKAPVSALISVAGDTDVSAYTLSINGDDATVSGPWPSGDVAIRFAAGGGCPVMLKHSMRLLVAHWYRVREAADEAMQEPPYAVEALVSEHRRGWVKS